MGSTQPASEGRRDEEHTALTDDDLRGANPLGSSAVVEPASNGERSIDRDGLAAPAPVTSSLAARVLWNQVQASLLGIAEPVMLDRFALRRCIGAGAMGELFAAYDEQLGREVAIKLVRSGRTHEQADQRLLREAKILAQISHPNVVQVYQVGALEGRVYVAMELVDGTTLTEWLSAVLGRRGRARTDEILRRFVAAGRGLAAAHEVGLAHRDFKPDNVLLGADGRIRVVDFGLARALDAPGGAGGRIESDDGLDASSESVTALPLAVTLTATGALVGTPRYMAPEQWQGARGDRRSDQFSFCVALYEALYGVTPFAGESALELAATVERGALTPPPRSAGVPAAVRRALVRGLAREPDARFATMAELLAVLERAVTRRRTALMAAITLALGLALALLIVALRASPDDIAERARQRERGAAARLATVETRIAEFTAAGQTGRADEAFAAFAAIPEHAETAALARGWLKQAERLRARGDDEAETSAYASAYVQANDAAEQGRALVGLARLFRRTGQWGRLGATLDTLARDHPDLSASREASALRVEAAVARRDFARALQELKAAPSALGPEVSAVVRHLAQLRATEHYLDSGVNVVNHVQRAPALDVDGDGRGEILMMRRDEAHISVLGTGAPDLPVVERIDVPHGRPKALFGIPAATGSRLVLVSEAPPQRAIYSRAERAVAGALSVEAVHQWSNSASATSAVALDELDGDGALELYLGRDDESSRFVALGPGPRGAWTLREPVPAIDDSNSWIHGLATGDVDGDGRTELVVALGEWGAYDVRVMRPDERGQLRLVARRKLGALRALKLLPSGSGTGLWIAVVVSNQYPNQRVFPPENPRGQPPGVYVLRLRGDALDIVHSAPVATPPLGFGGILSAGDINGDGLVDLAVSSGPDSPDTTLLVQTAEHGFAELTIRQLQVSLAADVDGDPAAELLALNVSRWGHPRTMIPADAPLVLLGGGSDGDEVARDDALPVLDDRRPTPVAPPAGIDDALRRAWHRAEDLAALGLSARAADALEQVAVVADPDTASLSMARAAELLVVASQPARAAELYERAAQAAADPDATLSRAAELYERVHQFADARRLAERLAANPALSAAERSRWRARAISQRVHTDPQQVLEFRFDEPLDSKWHIAHPLTLRRERRALRVEAFNSLERVVARRPVWWSAGPLTLETEIDFLGIEWGGGVQIAVVPAGGGRGWFHRIITGAAAGGGGGVYERWITCYFGQANTVGAPHPLIAVDPAEQRHLLRVEVIPEQRRMRCVARVGDVEQTGIVTLEPGEFAPGWYDLVIMTTANAVDGSPIRTSARLHRIRLTGVSDAGAKKRSDEPLSVLYRALSNGAFATALELLGRRLPGLSEHERELLRYLILSELERPDEAESALRSALGLKRARGRSIRCAGPVGKEWLLRQLLHVRPTLIGPLLRRTCQPAGYYHELWRTWKHLLHQHPDDDSLHRLVTTQLGDIDSYRPDPAGALAFVRLLRARARARTAAGSLAAARGDLQRVLTVGRTLLGHVSAASQQSEAARAVRSRLRQELAESSRELAEVLLAQGEDDRAMDEIRSSLELATTPAIQADTIATRPGLRDLHGHPEWATIVDAGRHEHAPERR